MSLLSDAAELRGMLGDLTVVMNSELVTLWDALQGLPSSEVPAALHEAVPDTVGPYMASSAEITADWYDELQPESSFRAVPADPVPVARLDASVGWALAGDSVLERLAGSMQRAVLDASRDTVKRNVGREPGARWTRYASATACEFCRMLVTRGAAYSARSVKFRSHDHCKCMAVAVRPGQDWTPPGYVEEWERQYKTAAASVSGPLTANKVVAAWRQL